MSTQRRHGMMAVIAMLMVAAGAASSVAAPAAPLVDATLEPRDIAVGESARLTILTSGSGTLSLSLPVVDGLEFRVVAQSHQFQLINGAAIESTSTVIRVTANAPGIFTIPGMTPKSPPLVLRVNPGGGNSSSLNNGAAPALPFVPGPNTSGVHLTPDGSAFVRLEVPKHEIYVGESVPAEIQIGLREGFATSINGLPKLNSSDFTLNNLSLQPERSEKVIDGKPFTIFTWRSVLAGIKPGSFPLTFAAPVTVRVRTQPARDSMLDDLLGDPFLQNIFGAAVRKNVTVSSPETVFTVLPLPEENRPRDFGGAVGSFKINTDISSTKNTAGDPLTLRMHVSGSGNFDRVKSSMLGADAEWKTYEPKATFSAAEPTGFRGEKIFEQPLIASQPGDRTVPPLSFSYFDPGTRRYETLHSPPLHVAVSPSPADSAANEPPPPATAAGTPVDQAHTGLRPDHAVAGARVASLIPLYFQPRYLGASSLLALLFGGSWLALRYRERNADDRRRRARQGSRLTDPLLAQMTAAAAAGDAALFFNSARSALQQTLSMRWQMPPEEITETLIDARLDHNDKGDVRQIFALADEANYSGDDLTRADFERWIELVRRESTIGEPS